MAIWSFEIDQMSTFDRFLPTMLINLVVEVCIVPIFIWPLAFICKFATIQDTAQLTPAPDILPLQHWAAVRTFHWSHCITRQNLVPIGIHIGSLRAIWI